MADEPEENWSAARAVELPEKGILVLREQPAGSSLAGYRAKFEKNMFDVYEARGPGLGVAVYHSPSVSEHERLMRQLGEDTTHPAALIHFFADPGQPRATEEQLVELMNSRGMAVWSLWAHSDTAARGKVRPPRQDGRPYLVTIDLAPHLKPPKP